ncbi:alpha/beta hydrolase [bacterium]|nr:alpha/beta hydrolase [bacterium]
MRLFSFFAGTYLLVSACGSSNTSQPQSALKSEKFSIRVFGIEAGSCTRDELTRFVSGEDVPAISGKLSKDQQIDLRIKFSHVLKISPARAQEAISSDAGDEVKQVLEAIFAGDYSSERVEKTFVTSINDGTFTLLEFVSRYPTSQLRINGLAFVSKQDKLESALLQLESQFRE